MSAVDTAAATPCPSCGTRSTEDYGGNGMCWSCFEREPVDWLAGEPMDPTAVPAEPEPALPGFPILTRGRCALISGPTGAGRSALVQAMAYDAAREGLRVAYLGSEITVDEFNARAADLVDRRSHDLDDALRADLARVRYLDLQATITAADASPDGWIATMTARYDVVIIDPLSAVASALDLDFDKSNAEFVRVYDRLIQPLATGGLSVIVLENIGHALEAKSRAKGASAKQDRADLTFSCKLRGEPVGLIVTAGKTRGVRTPWRRGDSWTFDRETQRISKDTERLPDEAASSTGFRPTSLMLKASRAIEAEPGLTRNAIRTTVGGATKYVDLALELLVSEGHVEIRPDGQARRHYSTRPFEDTGTDRDSTGTHRDPSPGEGPGTPGLRTREESRVPVPTTLTIATEPGLDLDRADRLLADHADLNGRDAA